jgi:hypothetical protein
MSLIQSYIVQYRDLPINTLMNLKKSLKQGDVLDNETKLLAIDIILRGNRVWTKRKTS